MILHIQFAVNFLPCKIALKWTVLNEIQTKNLAKPQVISKAQCFYLSV